MTDDIIVAACGLVKRFGATAAVDRVSLAIRRGEFVTLLGPSGCGKTTLLRLIAGFDQPDVGTIFLDGRDVTELPPYERNVNQVFQSYALFPHLDVAENIAFGLRRLGRPRAEISARVEESLQLVSLQGFGGRRPDQLSGGQRQRVALARALAPRPAVLLLDEPLSALDAKLRRNMQLELKRLQKQLGLTFIFVTHDQEEALTMSDRVAVMNEGRIEQIGTPAEIYNAPSTSFVAGFVGESNLSRASLLRHKGSTAWVSLEGGLELQLPGERWPAGASTALVGLRPEKLELSRTQDPAEPNQWSARVVDLSFFGAVSYINLQTESGTLFRALAPARAGGDDLMAAEDKLYCRIKPENITVIPVVRINSGGGGGTPGRPVREA